jgi:hypothetical protein
MDTRQLIASFMSPEAGQQRRAWLERQAGNLSQYVPPELRPMGSAAAELNPVTSMERAGQASQTMFAPGTSGWGRVGAAGDMLSNVAGVVAPGVAAKGSTKTAQAIEEMLLGASMPQREALRQFAGDDSGALRLFHGSPHDFDKFSMDKIGTGEGAQAYGHGLYFADNEATAKWYRDEVSSRQSRPVYLGKNAAGKWRVDILGVGSSVHKTRKEAQEAFEAAKAQYIAKPSMYEVNVNANPEDFLDWDAPLSAQPKAMAALVDDKSPPRQKSGEANVSSVFQMPVPKGEMERRAREAGIPGIRYLDAGSRNAGDGSRNYVVFDENLISIVRKYGIAGAAVMLGMSQADVVSAAGMDAATGQPMAMTPPRAP